MLQRKTIIVLVITLMVAVMVTAFSILYIAQILRLRITNAKETATSLTHQLAYAAANAVPDFSSTSIDTSNSVAVRRALADYVQTDVALNNLLQSDPGDWRFIWDVSIVDVNGRALLHTNAGMVGKVIPPRPDFQRVVKARFQDQFRLVFSPAEVYEVTYPLELNGEPFGTIRIGVQTVFLKSEVQTRLMRAAYISVTLVFVSLFLAAGISNLALGPLKEISRNLDSVSAGDAEALYGDESHQHDE